LASAVATSSCEKLNILLSLCIAFISSTLPLCTCPTEQLLEWLDIYMTSTWLVILSTWLLRSSTMDDCWDVVVFTLCAHLHISSLAHPCHEPIEVTGVSWKRDSKQKNQVTKSQLVSLSTLYVQEPGK
jgi:hypothetical protein